MTDTTKKACNNAIDVPNSDNQGGARTALLVDDDVDFVLQLKMQLESQGWQVVTAHCEKDAREILAGMRPDLAVVDLMMEDVDGGFVLCHQIKKKDPSIPVILVTSVTSETRLSFDTNSEDERSWIKADAFLAKPIRFEQLMAEIDHLLKGAPHGNAENSGH